MRRTLASIGLFIGAFSAACGSIRTVSGPMARFCPGCSVNQAEKACANALPTYRQGDLPPYKYKVLRVVKAEDDYRLRHKACTEGADALVEVGAGTGFEVRLGIRAGVTTLLVGQAVRFTGEAAIDPGIDARSDATPARPTITYSQPVGVEHPEREEIARLAVIRLAGGSLEEGFRDALTDVISAEASRTAKWEVFRPEDLNALLAFDKQQELLGCEYDVACVAEIVGAYGVDALLLTTVGDADETHLVAWKLIKTATGQVLLRSSATVLGGTAGLIEAVSTGTGVILAKVAP